MSTADAQVPREATQTHRKQWDARAAVNTAPPQANRRIGITVGHPYFNRGAEAVVVEITRECPVMHTRSSIGWYPVADTAREVELTLISTIGELDRVIGELSTHRDRLNKELAGLGRRQFLTGPIPRVES